MSKKKKLIAILLCIVLISSYVTYRVVNNKPPFPDIIVVAYGQETEKTRRLKEEIGEGTIHDIQTMVTSSVAQNLMDDGFSCGTGIAYSLENDNYTAAGIYYYDSSLNLFDSSELQSVGFIQVVSDTVKYEEPSHEASMMSVVPNDNSLPGKNLICTYSYENITPTHLVYQNYYVTYYQQSPMRVVYSIAENKTSNYDFSLGSLYDFDSQRYIYDSTILGDYQTHSGLSLFSETDYQALETQLQEISDQQYLNGYYVSEYRIVYISPENVQAYIDSEEEDTFFGYGTRELTEAFGYGTALTYTEKGFQSAKLLEEEGSYNWKSFLTKVGIGCGILIIGAILAPVTGGTSFGCALITATKITVGASLVAGLGTLTIETASGLIQGKSFEDALHDASHKGLDTFANTFLITSVVASVGVASGAIKPSACFVAGTEILTDRSNGQNTYKPIEKIQPGDSVLSWDPQTGIQTAQAVLNTFVRDTDETILLTIGESKIETTREHPFWSNDTNSWCAAGELKIGEKVMLADGSSGNITDITIISHEAAVQVYNFEVSGNHTYYVSKAGVLVHNKCDSLIGQQRSKAVKDAWKRELEAVNNGTSKYNWSTDQIRQLRETGKIKDMFGHHIKTVRELIGTAQEHLISSADDIVFLTRKEHLLVHNNNTLNPTNIPKLVELLPWVVERFSTLGIVY